MVRVLSATIALGVFAMFGLMMAGSGPGGRQVYAAAVTLSAQQGSPGDQVRVTGSGFDAGRRIRLSWDGRLYLGDTRIDDSGGFALAFVVPHDAEPGQHTVTYHVLSASPGDGVLIEADSAQTPLYFSVGGPGVSAQPVAQQPAGGAQRPATGAQQPANVAKPPSQRPGVDVGSNRPVTCDNLPPGAVVPPECLPTPYPCVPHPGPGAPAQPPRIPGVPDSQQPEWCAPTTEVMPLQVTATPTPGGPTPTPPGGSTPTPPGGSTPTPPGGTGTPTPPGGTGTPTPPGGTGTPTPPGGTGTPTPPGGTGTPTPPGGTGTPTPPGGTGTPTPPGGTGTPTPPGGTGTPTPPGGTGTPTPPGGTGTPTPPSGTSTPTPPGGTGTPTPPGGTGTPTPPGGTGTPTPPGGTSTPTPPGGTGTPTPPGGTGTPTPPGGTSTPTPPGGSTATPTPPGQTQPTPTPIGPGSPPPPTTEVLPARVTPPAITGTTPQQPTTCVYPTPGVAIPAGVAICTPTAQRTVVVQPGQPIPVVVPGGTQALPKAGAGQLRTDQGTDWGPAMVMLGLLLTTANIAIMVRRRRLDS